ncbi:MAG: glutathione S-transferase [Solirubrobacterales bacterium]|nr:glutathione S-transferase [Solirubrobacterales bacterium]MCB0859870.1 glutathione S-transferase [Solirubrobacterales bacterium]MCB0862810.1 glutathione S-transferase [Solirubrobacterales bacterium]HRV60549.1 glutathione S-transferase [Solirubrobacterales bacterium]
MPITEKVTLHALPPSHPCKAVGAALDYKGIEYEWVNLDFGKHNEQITELYGEGKTRVPGLTIGEERVHGSTNIFKRLEELVPELSLYPEGIADEVREAELWGDRVLQDLGRRIPWGGIYFRPEMMGKMNGIEELDPAGTDFAMKFVRATWKYHNISCVQIAEDLEKFPGMIDEIEGMAADGLVDGENPTAADLQIGSSIWVIGTISDVKPVIEGSAAERIAERYFGEIPEMIPAGALPASWIKLRD